MLLAYENTIEEMNSIRSLCLSVGTVPSWRDNRENRQQGVGLRIVGKPLCKTQIIINLGIRRM